MKNLPVFGAALALSLVSAASHATTVKADYTVNLNDTEPGLVVHSANVADNPFSFDLTAGESKTFDLFDIWTNDAFVNYGEDTAPKLISVDFGFLLPKVFDSSIDGTTKGYTNRPAVSQGGELSWSGPANWFFGPNSDGHLRLSLTHEIFNSGLFGTSPGETFGATVEATVTLVQDATSVVPEPGTLGFLGLGVLGLAATARRRYSQG